ncbi:transcription factor TFIIIB component B'' homolog isoform X2 [Hyla sarda]|uniref:transcription factor TFIIIB component B'' homolog isoform X2 n=1 Tax=Hyla sarda TaxID=327740 RepID=UPI0024C292F2|nr:transcription factor TFIIIB component B'' homolog isoform X2 [Hyla sarda]
MIRRARLSFKPNVKPSGRLSSGQGVSSGRDGEVVPAAEPVPDPGRDSGESITAPVTEDPVDPQPQEASKEEPFEKTAAVSNETPPCKITSTPLQRRKRISTLPNLAKPRLSNSASAAVPPPKPSPVDIPSSQPASIAPCKNEGPSPEKGKVLSPQRPQVPVTPSQVQHVTLPEKRTPVPQVPQFSPYKKSVLKHQDVSPAKPVECTQKEEFIPLKERPSQKSCSNEPFELDKKMTQKKIITSNLEKERIRRAQKLRDLLKEQLQKERRSWREKHPIINSLEEPERSKMTMRDFVHFIPMSNPMSSSLEETKSCEKSFVEPPATGLGEKNSAEEDEPDDDVEEDESQLLAPRVKVAEDGSIILDEESLTVEVCRNKAPIVEGNDPIFERGSTTTYASFRRSNYSKPWSDKETDMFFLAISMVGTDFSMISQLFPHRKRIEIKNKFKKEERMNGWRIDKAFREKKDFDFEFFAHLLEKALAAGKKTKTTKSKQPRKTNTKTRKKQKDKTAAEQSLCDEESVISEEEGADAGTAEKENKRSLGADESSGVSHPVPVKKKRVRRKKDNPKEPEEETHDSQDDEFTQKPKKKSRKGKTAGVDVDIQPDPQSGDCDGSLKETPAERKKRVQKKKPNYKEPELEDNENDDFDITEDVEIDDDDLVSCKPGEADLSCQSVAPTCEEESSLVLFTEESDYQSGLDDLSGMYQSVSEVNEAISQASDMSLVAPNILPDETEPVNVTQDETSPFSFDKFDSLDGALDAGHGQLGEQDLEPEKAEASSTPHSTQNESSIKPTLPEKGRLQRPKPNLPARTSTRREKLDVTDSEDIPMEGTEKCADLSDVNTQKTKDDSGNPNRGDIDVPVNDKQKEDNFSVEVSSPVERDAGSESDLSQTEGSNTVLEDTRTESSSGSKDECGKSTLKPAALARGHFQRPKLNLIKPSSRKEASDDCAGHAEGDIGRGLPSDSLNEKEEKEVLVNTGSEASQDSCKSDNNLNPSSLLPLKQDSARNQDNVTEACIISDTQSIESPIKPAPLARAKQNLVRSKCKGESAAASLIAENRAEGDLHSSCAGNSTELSKEAPSVEQHCSERPDSKMTLKVDNKNLKEPCMPSAVSPKGRFQKPILGRAAAKRDASKDEPCVESALESKDTTLNIPVNEFETALPPEKTHEGRSVVEEDSNTIEKLDSEASHVLSLESTCTMTDKMQTGSAEEGKTLKPDLRTGGLQRPTLNISRSTTISVEAAPLVSTVEKEEKRAGSTSTDNSDPNISLDVGVLSDGDAEIKSPTVKNPCDKDFVEALKPVSKSDAEQSQSVSLKSARTRFPKPNPNLGRATLRKETSTVESKILVPEKGEETLNAIEKNPENNVDMPDATIAGHSGKEAGHIIEEKSAAIKPAALKRRRLIRPILNLGKSSAKTLSPIQTKTNEDLNSSPSLKDKVPVVANSSPANIKRKASGCYVDSSPKRICLSSTPQKPPCSSDSEVDQVALTSDPQSSCQSGSEQGAASPQCSRFGRPLRKLTSPPPVSSKSDNLSDRPEKEKATHNVKSSTTKASKPGSSKSKGKATLVKIRARQQEEDEEEDADLGFEEENYDLTPEMQNQAPVFVPFSLRSPRPVTAEIEETGEELEIPVELPNNTNQDLERTSLDQVVDSEARQDKKEQCDGSAEAAMTLISMGSSVYKTNIGEFLSPDQYTEAHRSRPGRQHNQEQLPSLHLLSSPSVNVSSPHHDMCAMESSFTVDSRVVEDPYCAATLQSKTQTNGISSDYDLAENLPNVINDSLTFPVEQISYPVIQGNALQQDISSQDTSVSGCFLGEHDTGEEATFILTLVEIPINDDYAYSCDSNVAESLPAPVLISSGSSQALTQNLNSSVETVISEPCVVGQDDNDLMLGQMSKRSAQCVDEVDHTPPQKKPLVSEQVVNLEIKATALATDGKATPEVSLTEHKPKEPAGGSQVTAPAVRERPPNWATAKDSTTVPVEMPGMSMTKPSNRNLPLVYANPVTTSKTTLKRPGKKPLGFLSLVCKDKKSNEETLKNNLPKPKCRKITPTVHARQKKGPNLSLENATESEVPSSSPVLSPSEEALPSTSRISELQATPKSPELATEEEAAPVSQYFFSDIFMEVDD